MKLSKSLAVFILSATWVSPTLSTGAPVPALAPQAMPPEASQAIDSVNHALENGEVPIFDSRVLSIGLGALAGVLVYNLLPGTQIMTRAVPTAMGRAVGRMGATIAINTPSHFPMMTSAVIGALVGDYLYRKNNRLPSIPAHVMERISP